MGRLPRSTSAAAARPRAAGGLHRRRGAAGRRAAAPCLTTIAVAAAQGAAAQRHGADVRARGRRSPPCRRRRGLRCAASAGSRGGSAKRTKSRPAAQAQQAGRAEPTGAPCALQRARARALPAKKRPRGAAGPRERVRALVAELVAEALGAPRKGAKSDARRWARGVYVGMSGEELGRVVAEGAQE